MNIVHADAKRSKNSVVLDSVWFASLKWSFLENNVDARLGLPVSVGPDFAAVRLGMDNGIWKNLVGQNLGLVKLKSAGLTISSVLAGFIELHDITPQFMSWQLWRGNLGFDLYLEQEHLNKLLPAGSRAVLRLGWAHESQHVTDHVTFMQVLTNIQPGGHFDNASARSFEWFTMQVNYVHHTADQQWTFLLSPGYCYYPRPLLPTATYNLRHAFNIEAGVHYKTGAGSQLYTHVFKEVIQNSFVSNGSIYKRRWNREPFQYLIVEGGFQFHVANRLCDLFLRYNQGNGRGLDFMLVSDQVGAGVRFLL